MSIFTDDDIQVFRSDRLFLAAQTLFPGVVITDDYLMNTLYAAEKEISRRLKVFLEPTKVFPFAPADSDLAALATAYNGDGPMPWVEEAAYDYDAQFFKGNRWGYIVTREHPIISIDFIRFNYPSPTGSIYVIPNDWQRLDKKFGHIRLVPASSTFVAPLGAFILQALGGGDVIPAMLEVQYTAGLADPKNDWPDLIDTIYKLAVAKIIEGLFLPQSGSISGDGLSQSQSLDTSKYRDLITETLMGPKGSNGGLWTALHGLQGTAFGPTS